MRRLPLSAQALSPEDSSTAICGEVDDVIFLPRLWFGSGLCLLGRCPD